MSVFSRSYHRRGKQLLIAFPLLYLLVVVVLRLTSSSDPHQGLPVQIAIDTFKGQTSFEQGDDVLLLGSAFKAIGGALDNELSFRWFDHYDPRLKFGDQVADVDDKNEFVDKNSILSHFMMQSPILKRSMFQIKFNEEIPIKAFDPVTYSPGDARFIDTLIRKGYGFTFYLDSQPVHFTISTDDIAKYRDTRFLFSDNVPLGFVDRYNRAVLFNAYRFDIFYRRRPDNRFNIVMATVHPLSMTEAHQRDEGFDIRDFVFLSENHPTDVQWMYSVRFHTDEEANVRQFSPKMALEMPQLSYYYRRYLATCAAVLLFAPLLVYVLVARFSPMQPRHSSGLALLGALGSTCLAWFPTVASVCFFAACTSLFWLFSVAALNSNSIAFPIVSAALAAPLMGLVCLRLRSTFSRKLAVRTPFSAGGQMVALSAGFGLFVSLGFFVLELITRDVRFSQLLFFLAGICMLVVSPGALLGKVVYQRSHGHSPIEMDVRLLSETEKGDEKERGVEYTVAGSRSGSSSSSSSGSGSAGPAESEQFLRPSAGVPLSGLRAFLAVLCQHTLCMAPLWYPASELFFGVVYSTQYSVQRFALHSIFAMFCFAIPYYFSTRTLLSRIPVRRLLAYAVVSVLVCDLVFWSRFFKGFGVFHTKGGLLFIQQASQQLYQWFDEYDSAFFVFLLSTFVAVSFVAVFSVLAVCFSV